MDFINKLIKKGIFSAVLLFLFFSFGNEIKVNASTCYAPVLNDGDKYLVLSANSGWKDNGVTVTCDDGKKQKIYSTSVWAKH